MLLLRKVWVMWRNIYWEQKYPSWFAAQTFSPSTETYMIHEAKHNFMSWYVFTISLFKARYHIYVWMEMSTKINILMSHKLCLFSAGYQILKPNQFLTPMDAPFFPPNQAFHFILFLCETHSGFVSFPRFTSWWLDVKHLGCPLSLMQYTHTGSTPRKKYMIAIESPTRTKPAY